MAKAKRDGTMFEMYTFAEAARVAGVSRQYMHLLVSEGRIGTIIRPAGYLKFRTYVSGRSLWSWITEREKQLVLPASM